MPRGWPKGKPRGLKPVVKRRRFTTVEETSRISVYMPFEDWPMDCVEADEQFIEDVRSGRIGVFHSYKAPMQREFIELDLEAWRSRQGDKRKWAQHVLEDGLDHFLSPGSGKQNRTNGHVYKPVPSSPVPYVPREPLDTERFYYVLGCMVTLKEAGWNYMEIAKQVGQDPGFVRHHVGGARVHWVRNKDEKEREFGVVRMT